MHPNQPNYGGVPPAPTQQSNQYDFIVNTGGRRPGDLFNSAAFQKSRIAVVVGGVILISVAIWVFIAILSGSNGPDTGALTAIVQRQSEIARIANLPGTNNGAQPTQNFAASLYLTMLSDQHDFVTYLSQHGSSLSAETLAANKNVNTDAALSSAKTSGTYDTVFIATMQQQLTAYEQALQQSFKGAKGQHERALLSEDYNHAKLLDTQSSQQE